jgi:coiled-coil domain-containing protein 130
MPFPIWCTTCPKPTIIGQGVRFNAEKKKVGNYYSTPIFSFRMKHVTCGGWIEIRTDPKNTAYVVTEGANKRDTGDDKVLDGDFVIRTDEERERLRNDAFAALEVTIDDRKQATVDKTRIDELLDAKDKDWDDPYAASRKLRRAFRVERKLRERNQASTEDLKDRLSLGIDLLEENNDDRRRAQLIEFGDVGDSTSESAILKAQTKPLFKPPALIVKQHASSGNKSRTLKAEAEAMRTKEILRQELQDNTRAALDPFLNGPANLKSSYPLPGIKRKRNTPTDPATERCKGSIQDANNSLAPLVDYDSD